MSQPAIKHENEGHAIIAYRWVEFKSRVVMVESLFQFIGTQHGQPRFVIHSDQDWDMSDYDGPPLHEPGIFPAGSASHGGPKDHVMATKESLEGETEEMKAFLQQIWMLEEGQEEESSENCRCGGICPSRKFIDAKRDKSSSEDEFEDYYEEMGLEPPDSRVLVPVQSSPRSQGGIEDGGPHETPNVSATSDHDRDYVNTQAETNSAPIPWNADLAIRISHKDSSDETQTMEEPRATSSQPLADFVLANEEEAEYVLANGQDHLGKDNSNCEDDMQTG